MKFLTTRPKKIIFWMAISLLGCVVVVIACLSPITKYLIEKYDQKFLGREITLDRAYVNPFTGFVRFSGLRVFEYRSDSVALSCVALSCNFEMLKLLSRTYEVSALTLDQPVIKVAQNKKSFSFDDLVQRFASTDTVPTPADAQKEPTRLNLLNLSIRNGTFYYIESSIPVRYNIRQVNIASDGLRWNSDSLRTTFSFVSGVGTGGSMKGRFHLNLKTLDFRLEDKVEHFDLAVLEQYVRDIANYGQLRATLDADIVATGNFKDPNQLNASGPLAIHDFHLGKRAGDDLLAFKTLALGIVRLSPAARVYQFDSVSLLRPYFNYERYDHLDNLQYMFGAQGEKVNASAQNPEKVNILFQIGGYIQQLARNFFRSDYQVRRLAIYDADLRYNDYALTEKFAVAVRPLTLIADSIERGERWVNLSLRTGIVPYGRFTFDLRINPRDSSDFDFSYRLWRVPMALFNPYLVTYTSFPLDRGILEFSGSTSVRNGVVDSKNHLVVIDPRVNARQKRNGNRWLPLRAFMFLVRERGNVIDYEVPITGNLKNPDFKFRDVVLDVLTNIFVKPATVPYRTEVRNVENAIEKSLTVKWVMRQAALNPPQEKFIRKVADFLKERPGNSISVSPEVYTEKELEYQLFFEAKKRFYLAANGMKAAALVQKDSLRIEQLSVRDSAFIHFLNRHSSRHLPTVQEKCRRLVPAGDLNRKLAELSKARRTFFVAFFRDAGVAGQVKFMREKDTIPFNGFSQFRITYNSEFPEDVLAAYEEIRALDNRNPRNKFKEKRSRNRVLLDAK